MSGLKEELSAIDWSIFNGPSLYDSTVVPSVLVGLMEIDGFKRADEAADNLVYAIGNDHAGIYYPVVLQALDYIIDIGKNTQSKACKACVLSILNDLYYFEPEVEGYNRCSAEDLKQFVKDKLKPYADEPIEYLAQMQRGVRTL